MGGVDMDMDEAVDSVVECDDRVVMVFPNDEADGDVGREDRLPEGGGTGEGMGMDSVAIRIA